MYHIYYIPLLTELNNCLMGWAINIPLLRSYCHARQVGKICLAALMVVYALSSQAFVMAQMSVKGVRLEGVVMDQSRAPVAGADVTLSSGASVIAQFKTDTDGRFFFDDVRVREAEIIIRAQGFATVERRWTARDSVTQTLEVILTPAPITEQVTVTASRTEARLGETAASVSLLTPAELQTTAALRLDDALRQVAGFSLFRRSGSRTANPTTQGVSLRGVGASGASRALVLVDGLPLNDPFGGWVYWGRVPRSEVSRVEVLRGGASHLYGGGALGGVVNIITPEPASAPSSLSLEVSYGNQQTPDATLFASARRGEWAASLGAEMSNTDGYILVDERERGPVDTPAGSRYATSDLTIERKISDEGRLFVRGALFGESRTNGTPLQTNRTHIRQLTTGADFQIRRFGSFTFRAYGGTEVYDQNFSAVSNDRTSETLTRVQRVPSQFAGFTFQWSRAVGTSHTLVAGLEAREVRGASDEIAFVQNRPSSTVGAGGRERTTGLYLEDIFRITPRLFLTAGLRLDRWREFAALSVTRLLRQPEATSVQSFPDRTETAFSPYLSLLYKPYEKVSFAASFTKAFRQPTLNELYRSFRVGDVLTLSNENLRAERLSGAEVGTSFYLFNQRLVLRGTLFWTEVALPVANVTLRTTPALITRQRQNLGRTRSRGLELEMEARLATHWTITGGYLFADATVLEFPANTALEGLDVPQVARHQATFQVRYANPSGFTFGLQGRAAGNQFDDDQNRFPLGGYFILDAFASRHLTRSLELFAAAENLFDQRYTTGRTPITTIGPPLLVRLGLRLSLKSSGQ
jgi:outer membrane receptor protein involved in Fe transport